MPSWFLGERKAHPPLGAWAEVSHGDEVVVTGKHVNRTAPSGWMVRLVRFLIYLLAWSGYVHLLLNLGRLFGAIRAHPDFV